MAKSRYKNWKREPRGLTERKLTIVIATEGEKTEPNYFKYLQRKIRLINIEIVSRNYRRTEPMQVLDDLIKHKDRSSRLRKHIVGYWIVIDNDGRRQKQLDDVVSRACQNDCFIADSNPCFEVWLIQHFASVTNVGGFLGNARAKGCDFVIGLLKKNYDRSYEKSRYDVTKYMTKIADAVSNAQLDDKTVGEDELRTNSVGSRVYKLAQSIIDSSPNNL